MKLVLKSIRKNIIVNKWGKILSLTLLLPILLLSFIIDMTFAGILFLLRGIDLKEKNEVQNGNS